MTIEEIQISTIRKLKSLNKKLKDVRREKTAYIIRFDEFYLEYSFELKSEKEKIQRLSEKEKELETELSNLIESL